MSSRTVLVTGATGLLGRQVCKLFDWGNWTVKGTGFSRADGTSILKVDLSNPAEVGKVLDDVKLVKNNPVEALIRHLTSITPRTDLRS